MKEIFKFLLDLKENNNREWFKANKARYDKLKKQFGEFTDKLITEISKIDSGVAGLTSKDCIFRIYKDVRFSKDKTPYKTHFGAYMAVGGRKSISAGYYLHYQPGDAFAGGGVHSPDSKTLNAIRTAIYNNPKAFKKIIEAHDFTKTFKELTGAKLKTFPRDFPRDFEFIDLIRFKEYLAIKPLSDDDLLANDLKSRLMEIFKVQKPFNEYINNALEF